MLDDQIARNQVNRTGRKIVCTTTVTHAVRTKNNQFKSNQPNSYPMSNNSKLNDAFAQSLRIDLTRITDELTFNTIEEWDSVAHMALVTEIETVFDVMLDTDEILDLSSVVKAREILSKHGVTF